MTREEFIGKFNIGDKVRHGEWSKDSWVIVLYLGTNAFFCVDNQKNEMHCFYCWPWELYIEPKKTVEKYLHRYRTTKEWRLSDIYRTPEEAEADFHNCDYMLAEGLSPIEVEE